MEDTLTLEEKQEKAAALIAEVKEAAAKGGGDDGQDYEAHRRKFEEAQSLMSEVKTAKREKEHSELLSLLEAFDKQAAVAPKGSEEDGIVTSAKSRLAELDEAKSARQQLDEDEELVRGMTRQKMAVANDTRGGQLFKAFKPERFEKAAVEGTASAGGYLAVPQYFQELFAAVRGQGNALRRYGWLNIHQTTNRQLLIPTGGGATTVGWVSEGATKPNSDLTFGQLSVNIFVLAGLAYVSLQMLEDADPAIADLASRDMALRLGNAEEAAIIAGTGTNMPRGILNTVGINDRTAQITASPTVQAVIDGILDCITDVQTNFYGTPNGILMRPRRLSFLQKGKDTANNYIFNAANTFRSPGGLGSDNPGVTSVTQGTVAPTVEFFGLPIGLSSNIPNNLTYSSGTGEDAIIVGDWTEAHWFQRQEVTVDSTTEGAGAFETNQIVYRMEERAGFGLRYPSAFSVLSGAGMVNG